MEAWIDDTLTREKVLVADVIAGSGRLGFAAGPLERFRPFLALLYAWTISVPPAARLVLPQAVRLVLLWLKMRLAQGERMQNYSKPMEVVGDWFRADAKASDESVAIGAWECKDGCLPQNARWMSLELTRQNAPWVFGRGEPYKSIAALELFATLISFKAFVLLDAEGETSGNLILTASTDNPGNGHLVSKLCPVSFD